MTTTRPVADFSTIASWARFILAGFKLKGLDTDKLLSEAGIGSSDLDNPNGRIKVAHMTQLWELAARDSADPLFTLRLADLARADMFSGLSLAMMFSETTREAIERMCRYSGVASSAAHLETLPGKNNSLEVIFHLQMPVAGEALEAFMACGSRILKQITQDRFRPQEVHFSHDKSAFRAQFEAFFEAPVFFNAPVCKFVVDEQVLRLPCYQSNPELVQNIDRWMKEYLERTDSLSITGQVQKLLLEGTIDGNVDQSTIARRLGMSSRRLQRALEKEGHGFRELLEKAKREVAQELLLRPELSLTDICYLLGFSDQSNFTKAFKRWTGKTPSSFRTAPR
ncbi:AraC family transcriptional regulator [Marinobacter sp. S6332]|uniref:AraC family transcriptional regulator n=1 Tax=Marinobacter sp. S6332 TaxID=2926403 RepID=UPI001FF53DFE|nr:AraC family transcriptional regulator [Marinobacter sp. S6332]MCK0165847.1 AraC family transcriptional regulator [Marinobacter sp. S6332]